MDKKAFTETAAGKQRTARRQRAERAPRDRRLVRQRMATCVRGLMFAGTGYLFGAAPIAFGACPLGLSLLAASSGYTWYILAGLILSALTQPSSLPAVAVIGVYVFCVLLRLAVLFFVDPPVLPGEEQVLQYDLYDAYYGDPMPAVMKFYEEKKPVMIQNMQCQEKS